jgi:ABC-type uncharacterized transport system ATPase subunit
MRKDLEQFFIDNDINGIFVDGHDNAIMGICRKFNSYSVLYDTIQIIENLKEDMTEEEAWDFYEFNIVGAWIGDNTPIFIVVFGAGNP